MTIEHIACPELNHENQIMGGTPISEVFVRFNEYDIPIEIMCQKYDSDKKACTLHDSPCLYQEWKSFK